MTNGAQKQATNKNMILYCFLDCVWIGLCVCFREIEKSIKENIERENALVRCLSC